MKIMGLNAPGLGQTQPYQDPTQIPDSFLKNIAGSFFAGGYDYDRSLMTRREYQERSQEALIDSMSSFGQD
jgi:hypothetical protein